MKVVLFVLALIYCASPMDLFPGPIDDAIICVVAGIIMKLFGSNNDGPGKLDDKYSR